MPIADVDYLDLIDENGKVIDKKPRNEVYRLGLNNFRVINAFVKNKEGKLLFPRRSDKVRIFPLCLDASVGGHLNSGEKYLATLKRKTFAELGINIDGVDYAVFERKETND